MRFYLTGRIEVAETFCRYFDGYVFICLFRLVIFSEVYDIVVYSMLHAFINENINENMEFEWRRKSIDV